MSEGRFFGSETLTVLAAGTSSLDPAEFAPDAPNVMNAAGLQYARITAMTQDVNYGYLRQDGVTFLGHLLSVGDEPLIVYGEGNLRDFRLKATVAGSSTVAISYYTGESQ